MKPRITRSRAFPGWWICGLPDGSGRWGYGPSPVLAFREWRLLRDLY